MFEFLEESLNDNYIDLIERSFNIISECRSYIREGYYMESYIDSEGYDVLYETIGDALNTIMKAIADFFRRIRDKITGHSNIGGAYSLNNVNNLLKNKIKNNPEIANTPISVPDYNPILKYYRDMINLVKQAKQEDIADDKSPLILKYNDMLEKFKNMCDDICSFAYDDDSDNRNIKCIKIPAKNMANYYRSIVYAVDHEIINNEKLAKKIANKDVTTTSIPARTRLIMTATTVFACGMNAIGIYSYNVINKL